MRRAARATLLLALVGLACGDDDDKTPAAKPTPTLQIESVTSAGGPTWAPGGSADCVEIGTDPGGTLVVRLRIQHFSLRPPGACGSLRPCGTAVLLLDGSPVAQSATSSISVGFNHFDAAFATGQRVFRVELHDHLGALLLDKEQNPITDEVTLDVRLPGGCGTGPDAGQDAGPPDASDAGEEASVDAATDAPVEASDAQVDSPGSDAADAADAAADAAAE
jgi:hypothetical protein